MQRRSNNQGNNYCKYLGKYIHKIIENEENQGSIQSRTLFQTSEEGDKFLSIKQNEINLLVYLQ